MNKKFKSILILSLCISTVLNTTITFALPKTSVPKLQSLETPKLSNSFENLKKNINNKGNLPNTPDLIKLPEMDLSEFDQMKENYGKGKESLSEEGFGKKHELEQPKLEEIDMNILKEKDIDYENKKNNLKEKDVSNSKIKNELKNFDKQATNTLKNNTTSNNKTVNNIKPNLPSVNMSLPKLRQSAFSYGGGGGSKMSRGTLSMKPLDSKSVGNIDASFNSIMNEYTRRKNNQKDSTAVLADDAGKDVKKAGNGIKKFFGKIFEKFKPNQHINSKYLNR